jgi:hypothetical protein
MNVKLFTSIKNHLLPILNKWGVIILISYRRLKYVESGVLP